LHSSVLRGYDFKLTANGADVLHRRLFGEVEKTTRLGVVAPNRFEGTGAALLILAYATAFYDRYREESGDFHAYPDFFVFQAHAPVASYGMLDVWPHHKMVYVEPGEIAAAVTDRAVNVLLLPEGPSCDSAIDKVTIESARRTISKCYAYSPTGDVANPDMTITCARDPVAEWVLTVFGSVVDDEATAAQKDWLAQVDKDTIVQSFREIALDEALAGLAYHAIGGQG